MTPEARIAAAIEIVDKISAGAATEAALLRWARANRYAGSKDRAAIRDLVFDCRRHWRSDAVRGGGTSGRLRIAGRLRALGQDPKASFTGQGYAPAPLTDEECAGFSSPGDDAAGLDVPEWLWPLLDSPTEAGHAWQQRAPVTLRVNLRKTTREAAQATLAGGGITTAVNERAPNALTVTDGARRVQASDAYRDGLVELQDASSQAVVASLLGGGTALDYCAGGGGKALALAAAGWRVTAHDADVARLRPLIERARRAGAQIGRLRHQSRFDLVLCDVPCSGSGAWRRSPDGKWTLTPERLADLTDLQSKILNEALRYVKPGGLLAYATCSVLRAENEDVIDRFVSDNPGWSLVRSLAWPIDDLGDGFFTAHLKRE